MKTLKGAHISLIDDDEAVRASTRFLLETAGYRISEFASAKELLASLPRLETACLVLDLHLETISGLELLELLRSRGNQTPAIFLTANGAHLESRYQNAGVLAVIRKPPVSKLLLDWVKKAVTGL